MKNLSAKNILLIVTTAGLAFTATYAQTPAPGAAQTPPAAGAAPGQGGRGGRGGGLPGATPQQNQAVTEMTTTLAPLVAAATTARNDLATVTFADVRNQAAINTAVEKLRAAELAVAVARADAFAKLQAGPCKLNAEQVTALVTTLQGGRGGGGFGGGGGRGPGGPGGPAAGAPGPAPAAPAAQAAPAAPASSGCFK
jgi:Spy/CpxP family protein refolding chaperone